jgi:hypothetical protein
MIEVVLPVLDVTEPVVLVEVTEPVVLVEVTEPVVLVRVVEGAEDVVVLEADIVEIELTGASIENAVYDTRIITTTTAAMITVMFLVMPVLKRGFLQFISYKESASQMPSKTW